MTDDPFAQFDSPPSAEAATPDGTSNANPFEQFGMPESKYAPPAPKVGGRVSENVKALPEAIAYPIAAARGLTRDIPFAQDIGAGINAARTYLGGTPAGVPTEGTFGERFPPPRKNRNPLMKRFLNNILEQPTDPRSLGRLLFRWLGQLLELLLALSLWWGLDWLVRRALAQ